MTFLNQFLQRFSYPPEARKALTEAQRKLRACPPAEKALAQGQDAYCAGGLDYTAANQVVAQAGKLAGVHEYTAVLLFYIRLAQPLEVRYAQSGIAPEIYEDTLRDLLYKAKECFAVHGVWGCFVGFWNEGFFNLTRFTLGRLQFERSSLPCDCTVQGKALAQGTLAINVHIPACGPLRKDDCKAAFAQAKAFFGQQPAIFLCDSWLLFPAHRSFLPPESNILMFMDFFIIVSQKETVEFRDAWRVFGSAVTPPYHNLPLDTGLQRAYATWLCAGNGGGSGVGVFIEE